MKVFWFNVNHISFMLTICGNTVEMARENKSIRWKNMSISKLTYNYIVNKLNFTVINCQVSQTMESGGHMHIGMTLEQPPSPRIHNTFEQ